MLHWDQADKPNFSRAGFSLSFEHIESAHPGFGRTFKELNFERKTTN